LGGQANPSLQVPRRKAPGKPGVLYFKRRWSVARERNPKVFCWKCGALLKKEEYRPAQRFQCANANCKARFLVVEIFGQPALALLNG
jgi:hypothetical protein